MPVFAGLPGNGCYTAPTVQALAAALAFAATTPVPDNDDEDLLEPPHQQAKSASSFWTKSYFGLSGRVVELGPFTLGDLDMTAPPSVAVTKLKKKICDLCGPQCVDLIQEGSGLGRDALADDYLCELEDVTTFGSHGVGYRILSKDVPDQIYALLLVGGDEGCSHSCAQHVNFVRQSYATAEEARAAAKTVFKCSDSEDSYESGSSESDDDDYVLPKLLLKNMKQDGAAMARLTDDVYCLLKIKTDMGHPQAPEAKVRNDVFFDLESALLAAPSYWGLDNLAELEAMGHTEDFGKELADLTKIEHESQYCGGAVVIWSFCQTLRIKKVTLPRAAT